MLSAGAFLWNDLIFVAVCQTPNSEGVSGKQDRRPVRAPSFARVVFLLLFLIIGGVSASKHRSWRKYPNRSPLFIGMPSARAGHTMVAGSDGALWFFGGLTGPDNEQVFSKELFKFDIETKEWTTITTSGLSPSARCYHTMTAVGTDLWVHGGQTNSGEDDERTTRVSRLMVLSRGYKYYHKVSLIALNIIKCHLLSQNNFIKCHLLHLK